MVVGLAHAEDSNDPALFADIAHKARQGQRIPLEDFLRLHTKQPFVTLPHTADLTKAVETFGSGIHRIVILHQGTEDIIGVLTQLRLVRFFWQNGHGFTSINELYQSSLQELQLGSRTVVSIK